MNAMKRIAFLLLYILLSSPLVFAAEEHLLPLQGTAKISNVALSKGDLEVAIYDASSGGNLLYNSSNDFLNVVKNGKYDILLGNGTRPLSLNYGTKYYMDIALNGTDLDFNGSERQVFISTIGNLSVTTPIRTTSTDADDALNVSNGGGNFRGLLSVQNYTSDPAFTVNYGFNISGASNAVITNGTLRIENAETDDAFNVTGGVTLAGSAGSDGAFRISSTGAITSKARMTNNDVDDALNVTAGFTAAGNAGSDGAFRVANDGRITSKVRITHTDTDDALNVTVGGVFFGDGLIVSNFFNLTNQAVKTNGTASFGSTVTILSADADDALNVSNGGGNFRGQLGVQNYTSGTQPAFTVNYGFNISGANNAVITNGTMLVTNTDVDDALNVTVGGAFIGSRLIVGNFFNISTFPSTIRTNGTLVITSTLSPALGIYGFTVSGSDSSVSTNGTVSVTNADTDDALNVTAGFTAAANAANDAAFRVFNTGLVQIQVPDANDALNVTNGSININTNSSGVQRGLFINSGGEDKCGFIALADVNGTFRFLFFNTSGVLRMSNTTPNGVGACERGGTVVGLQ